MRTEQQILQLAIDSATVRKKTVKQMDEISAYINNREFVPAVPDYYPGYQEIVKQYKHMAYHADAEIFPKELFAKRSPNITPEEEKYVESNYQNNTQEIVIDFINQKGKIFHNPNYLSFAKEDGNDSFEDYLTFGILEFGSLDNFMKSMGPALHTLDPNGVIAVKPLSFKFRFDQDGDQAVAVLDDTALLEPQPVYYRCDQVVGQSIADYFLILTDEKSEVSYGNQKVMAGLIYEYYDEKNIYRIIQIGKATELTFRAELYLEHNWQYVPCFKFRGVAKQKSNYTIWVSKFFFACHALDACLLNGSNLQTSINNCVFPLRIMVGDECQFDYKDSKGEVSRCVDGQVWDSDKGSLIECPSCNGVSLKSKLSPLGVLLLKTAKLGQPGDAITPANAMTFAAPPTDTLEFLREQIKFDFARARQQLHLKTTENAVTGPQPTDKTATSEVIDQREKDASTKTDSDQLFEVYANIAESMEWMRYHRDATFTITPPITFNLMSQADHLNDIAAKKAAGLPPSVINASIKNFTDASFYNQSDKRKIFDLINESDRLAHMSSDEVAFGRSGGTIAPYEVILHDSADFLINELILEDEKFLEKVLKEQKEAVIQKAKDKALEVKPATPKLELIKDVAA